MMELSMPARFYRSRAGDVDEAVRGVPLWLSWRREFGLLGLTAASGSAEMNR